MKLSVVMSVFNGGAGLSATLDSILGQTERDFELIAIDDGSKDGTLPIFATYAGRDPRIRVITQENRGLTLSLIRGCAEARAPIIARHDAGDRSHPERFAKQLALFREGVVITSVGTRFVSPEGEELYVTTVDGEEVRNSLLHDDISRIHGVPHPSSMFRRDAYEAAGGYREQFRIAQDVDLWVRMVKQGTIASTSEPLYDATVHPTAISSLSRDAQFDIARIVVALRDGGDEAALLAAAARLKPSPRSGRREAAGLYFIARCLKAQHSTSARKYLLRTIRRNPLHWRAWAALLTGR